MQMLVLQMSVRWLSGTSGTERKVERGKNDGICELRQSSCCWKLLRLSFPPAQNLSSFKSCPYFMQDLFLSVGVCWSGLEAYIVYVWGQGPSPCHHVANKGRSSKIQY
jgi:hypothetical protein